jgi:Tfp pilus assembly protein PilZ
MDNQGMNDSLTNRLIGLIHNISEDKKEQLLELLLEWQKNEQRGDERVPCLIPVDFSTQDRVYRDFIQNFSNGGVFIETRENLAPGQPVSLTFSAPNSQNHFKIVGTILRSEDRGVAVKFEKKLSRYQEEIIKNNPNQ